MQDKALTAADYPTAETQPDKVTGNRGKPLSSLTLDAVVRGEVEMEDLRITPTALLQQAQIAKSVGRTALADNLERAAEMTCIPQGRGHGHLRIAAAGACRREREPSHCRQTRQGKS